MKIYKAIVTVFVILLMLPGCEFFDLDKEPLNMISGAAIFEDEILVEAYMAEIYHAIPWH